MGFFKALACYGIGAWVFEVVLRPMQMRDKAVAAAQRRGKPLLNVGAGTPGSSIRVSILGPTMWGDVNCDVAGSGSCTPDHVCHCDIHNIPYPDKYFGAVIASHVLEHVDDPQRALREMHRVADEVFFVVPRWWGLHTWLQTEHKWYITKDMRLYPLWQRPGALVNQQDVVPTLQSMSIPSYPEDVGR